MQRTQKTHILKSFVVASAMVVAAGAAFAQTSPAPAPAAPGATQGDTAPHHRMGGPGEHGHHGGGKMWMKSVDTDGDGAISKAEADALFNKIDTNRDGKLDKSEMAAYRKTQWEQRRSKMKAEFDAKFKAADKNNDGALTRDEFKTAFPRMANRFDKLDANRDGKVTMAEIQSDMQKMHKDRMDRMERRGPGGASAPAVPSTSGN
ncbi:EF-hand domain-containing protein [Cupriavidus pauculus]|uniref:EF-hand domain-containing protein n=1 Tax=Cupriavidus pauculus TaxID=82633 RepID=A0A3G8GXY0_9BURK|nr:EF-hand domain-containing protein [Cupriavidus pauculus]AZG13116.1 EF-hand domain-containing protein [Cupriavidus pauculus]